MKARLGELQARLDVHERKNQTSPDPAEQPCIAPSAISTFPSHSSGEDSSPSPMSADKPTTPQSMPMMQQPAIYDHTDDLDGNMFAHGGHMLNSPPNSHHSPQANGLLSPPSHPVPDGAGKAVQPDFVLDCLRFQAHMLNRMNSNPEQYPPGYTPEGVSPATISQPGDVPCVGAFPNQGEFAFEPQVDVWKQDPMMPKMQETPPPSDVNFRQMPQPATTSAPSSVPAVMDPAMMNPAAAPQMPQPSNDERFSRILEHVQAAGFESFDALVTAYYSDNFGESSPLANEQRLSRNRRLPKVLADLFLAADQWTPWERRGFHEEILKTTESMLLSENAGAKENLLSKLGPILENQDQCTPETVNAMKRSVQNEMPNAWDLAMALATDNQQSWQRDRSNTALATTLLLNFAGRMPNEQLLQLIGSCL